MCFKCFLVWVGVDCLRVVSRVKDLDLERLMGECVFSNLWLQKSLYKEWLREVKDKARFIVCMKDVDILSMGESALTSHLKGKNIKHWHPRKGH